MKRLMPWNLQRFAGEENPEEVEVEVVDDETEEEEMEEQPAPTPRTTSMPSDVAPEAWRNVEEMLVTLSQNIRVGVTGIRDDVKALAEKIGELISTDESIRSEILAGLSRLGTSMEEFNTLLQNATVEVPEEEAQQNEQRKEEKQKRAGHLSRKTRGE